MVKHMASYFMALFVSFVAYKLTQNKSFTEKSLLLAEESSSLGGFFSAITLAMFSFFIIYESFKRIFSPEIIQFDQAIVVAIFGLIVNIICAKILYSPHHHGPDEITDEHNHDHAHHEHHHDQNLAALTGMF